ncbi:thiopeptide-type bacteriocin biosynthesis protein [Micromonospora sp. NPDC049903]|uniref:thiopeptide-type bacteriocin biosynthesis protein n=1 Tax=Micromonospora sp. NPDC049903 TaxID=3364276 RepID=UPI0037B8ECC1
MNSTRWMHVTVQFRDQPSAEDIAVTRVAPLFTAAEADRLISGWFFIRKAIQWRFRYLPTDQNADARAYLLGHLYALRRTGHLAWATQSIYEPELRAFGGDEAMEVAHRLWHADSRHVLTYLAATAEYPTTRRRREMAILLASAMLRAAGLDWYEQGDVWSKVAHHRTPPDGLDADTAATLQASLRQLMSTDADSFTVPGKPSTTASNWTTSFATSGLDLARLTSSGHLRRGLRGVLAHHIIFAMNRLGLHATTQAVLSTHAATVVFGPDPTLDARAPSGSA